MSKDNGWDVFDPEFEAWWRARPHLDATKGLAHEAWLAGQVTTQDALREALVDLAGRIERGEPARVGEGWADELRALAATQREPVTEGERCGRIGGSGDRRAAMGVFMEPCRLPAGHEPTGACSGGGRP